MGSKKARREMAPADDLNWVDDLSNELANEEPPANAVSNEALIERTGLEPSKFHRLATRRVKSGEWKTMKYKRRRYYWPAKREKQ